MSAYAYLDEYGVLHVEGEEQTAKESSGNGKYVETDIANAGGYPVVDGEVVIYEDGKAYIKGNEKDGVEIPTPAAIQSLLDQLK